MVRTTQLTSRHRAGIYETALPDLAASRICPAASSAEISQKSPGVPRDMGVSTNPGFTVTTLTP
jgi:hypothetical protein